MCVLCFFGLRITQVVKMQYFFVFPQGGAETDSRP